MAKSLYPFAKHRYYVCKTYWAVIQHKPYRRSTYQGGNITSLWRSGFCDFRGWLTIRPSPPTTEMGLQPRSGQWKYLISMTTMIGPGSEHVTSTGPTTVLLEDFKNWRWEREILSFLWEWEGRAAWMWIWDPGGPAYTSPRGEKNLWKARVKSTHRGSEAWGREREFWEHCGLPLSLLCGHVLPFSSCRNCLFGLLAWTRFLSLVTGNLTNRLTVE